MTWLETRPLDRALDWEFFDPADSYDEAHLAVIRPLTQPSAQVFWEMYVSRNPRERHPMLLSSNHWLRFGNSMRGPDWSDAWNARGGDVSDPVVAFLDQRLNWPQQAPVFFVWARERATLVPWEVFRRTWRSFLFSDEGPFLFNPNAGEVVWFHTGSMGICIRSGGLESS